MTTEIHLDELYGDTAKLSELPTYLDKAQAVAGEGQEVILTGAAPVWLYTSHGHN
jgi:hypothetical protein